MKRLPFLLVYSRIIIAVLVGMITFTEIGPMRPLIILLMSIGILTDIFDGIIARRLGVATEKLRVWDSSVDLFFWLVIILCIFYLNTPFFKENYLPVLVIILLEIAAYGMSYLKFGKPIATHSYMAKFWTLTLFAFLVDLTINSKSNFLFWMCAFFGILSRLEIILIIALLKKWTTDVPSIYSLERINRK